jgi:acyl transferase domain-containing protein
VRLAAARARAAFKPSAPARLGFVLERGADWRKTLASALSNLDSQKAASWTTPDSVYFSSAAPEKLAVLFPGQGAQYPGMQRDLACRFPEALNVLAAADAKFGGDKPLSDYLYPRAAFTSEAKQRQAEDLKDTRVAQPALGAAELGAWRAPPSDSSPRPSPATATANCRPCARPASTPTPTSSPSPDCAAP